MIYQFLIMIFIDNDFSNQMTKRHFLSICSKTSMGTNIILFSINLIIFLMYSDFDHIAYLLSNYGPLINNLMVIIGSVFIRYL